jgi:hypothetical protein
VNPYVNLTGGTGSTSSTAGSEAGQQPIIVSEVLVDESGLLTLTVAPPATPPRSWEEEEAADQDRAQALSEAWLLELEQAAQAQWAQLAGTAN